MPTQPIRRLVLLAAVFLLLGTVCTWPLARHFRQGIPYSAQAEKDGLPRHNVHGDHLQLYYRLWLFGEAAGGRTAPFRDAYEFSLPDRDARRVALYFLPYPLVFHAFGVFGRAAGYNAVLLLSYLLSGIFAYLLVRHYTGDTLSSLLGGTVFAASHYRTLSLLSGHPIGLSAFLLPLFVLCLEKVMKEKSLAWSLAGGLAFALLADNDLHLFYFTALVSPAIVAKNLAGVGWRRLPRYVTGIVGPALPLLVVAAGVLAAKFAVLETIQPGGQFVTRPLSEVFRLSPGLREVFVRQNPIITKNVYLGPALLFPLAFVLTGLHSFRRSGEGGRGFALLLFYVGLFALSYMLAFGPRFPFARPYLFLYHHLPKFALIRQTSKLMIVVTFSAAVVAGLGLASLRRALSPAKGLLLLAGAALVILLDALPFPGPGAGVSLLPRRVAAYDQAFGDSESFRAVHVPLWPGDSAWSSHYLYYSTIYRGQMINGYSPVPPAGYLEEVFLPLRGLNAGQVGAREAAALLAFDVDHLVLHEESFPPKVSLFPSQMTLENLTASPFLEPVSSVPPVSVFRIVGTGTHAAFGEGPVPSQTGVVHHELNLGRESVADEGASDGRAMRLSGAQGASVAVSRRTTPAGRFVLAARVRSEGPARFLLRTRSARDGSLLNDRAFTLAAAGSYEIFAMEFELEEVESLSHELVKGEGSTLYVDWISMRFAAVPDPPLLLEAEEIFHVGNAATYAGASGERALRLTVSDPPGRATRGPYRLFGPGEYEVLLSAAIGGEKGYDPAAPVFALAVRNHLDEYPGAADAEENLIMPERAVTSGDFPQAGVLTGFPFRFSLKRPTFLSFNVRHFARTFYLDTFTIRKVKE